MGQVKCNLTHLIDTRAFTHSRTTCLMLRCCQADSVLCVCSCVLNHSCNLPSNPPLSPRPSSLADMRSDIQEIFKMTPHDKQVMMFSATLSSDIRSVCKKFMSNVRTSPESAPVLPAPSPHDEALCPLPCAASAAGGVQLLLLLRPGMRSIIIPVFSRASVPLFSHHQPCPATVLGSATPQHFFCHSCCCVPTAA